MSDKLHAEALSNFLKLLSFDIDLETYHFNEDADPAVVGEAFMAAYRTNFEEHNGEEWFDADAPVFRACDIKDSMMAPLFESLAQDFKSLTIRK